METIQEQTNAIVEYLGYDGITLTEKQIRFVETCVRNTFLAASNKSITNTLEQLN